MGIHAYFFMNYEYMLDVNAFISTLRIFWSILIIDFLVSIVIELWSSHLLVVIKIAFRYTYTKKKIKYWVAYPLDIKTWSQTIGYG